MPCLQITWGFICCLMNVHKQILPRCPDIKEHWGSRWGQNEEIRSWDGRNCACLLSHTSAACPSVCLTDDSYLRAISVSNEGEQNLFHIFLRTQKRISWKRNVVMKLFSDNCRNYLIEYFMAVVKFFCVSHEKSKFARNHNSLEFSCWAKGVSAGHWFGVCLYETIPSIGCDWADDKICCLVQHYKIQHFHWSQSSLLNPGHFQHDNCSRN